MATPKAEVKQEAEKHETDDEVTRVFENRVSRFIALGFDGMQAELLASGTSHPTQAEKLLASGCTHRVATRILS